MPQFDFGVIDPSTKSGSQLASDLNNQRNAINSFHLGASEPAYRVSGMVWVDISANPIWKLKMYDGAGWIPLFDVDTVADAASAYIGGLLAALGTAAERNVGTNPNDIPSNSLLGSLAYLSTINTGQVANGAITNALMAALSVNTANLINNAVTGQKIAAGAISLDKFEAMTPSKTLVTDDLGNVTLADPSTGGGTQFYNSVGSYSFTVPNGVNIIKAWVIGGGGGGNGVNLSNGSPINGGTGGTSAFGSYISATGGISAQTGGQGVVGSGVIVGFAWKGSDGDATNPYVMEGGMPVFQGQLGPGDRATFSPSINYNGLGGKFPGGGAAGRTRDGYTNGRGAGGGGTAMAFINVTPGDVIGVTVGAGGTAGSGNYSPGKGGSQGMVLVEW